MSIFDYVNTALWVLIALSNVKTRRVVRSDLAKIRMYVIAHRHPAPVQGENTNG